MNNLNESQSSNTAESSESTGHPVPEGVRILRVSPFQKKALVATLLTGCLLGTVYYLKAPVSYEATASLLVTTPGRRPITLDDGTNLRLMTTHCAVIKANAVLEKAVGLLSPENRTDFKNARIEQRVNIVRKNLRVTPDRDANILKLAYRSRDPQAAVGTLDAVVSAYLEHMKDLQKNTALEIVVALDKERSDIEDRLFAKERELFDAQKAAGESMICDEQSGISVVAQRVTSLNEAVVEATTKRLKAEARYRDLQAAIENGRDLRFPAVALFGHGGYAVLGQELGLTGDSNENLATMLVGMAEHELEQVKAEEKVLRESYEQATQKAVQFNDVMAQLAIQKRELELLRNLHATLLDRLARIDISHENALRIAVLNQPEVAAARHRFGIADSIAVARGLLGGS